MDGGVPVKGTFSGRERFSSLGGVGFAGKCLVFLLEVGRDVKGCEVGTYFFHNHLMLHSW